MPRIQADALNTLIFHILQAAGAPDDYAQTVSTHLVDANLAGHDSHGVLRAPHYVRQIDNGRLIPTAKPEIVDETSATAQIDGHWTFGQVIAKFGTELAIEKARSEGVAFVTMYHEGHTGRLGTYPEMVTKAGMAAALWDGCIGGPKATQPPLNGIGRKIGANPIAMGFPGEQFGPVILDFATSMVAVGKVLVAQARGESLAAEWVVDADGNPSTNPHDWENGGTLRPLGMPSVGHKGYALAFMVGLLGMMASMRSDVDFLTGDRWGTALLVIDISRFGSPDSFRKQVDQSIQFMKDSQHNGEVLYPGEFELRNRRERLEQGIEIPDPTWQEIVAYANRFNLDGKLIPPV
jgi:uncharacterized oxidoreductase